MTLAEAKRHLRLEPDETDEDDLIASLISVAREYAEGRQWKKLAVRDFELKAAADRTFQLPPPCQEILSVVVTDKDGQAIEIPGTDYYLYSDNYKASLVLSSAYKYPSLLPDNRFPVQIEFTCGLPTADVPKKTKHAILLLVGHWYENREASTEKKREKPPFAVDALLDMDRTWY
ncbi:head-tail connector protein [Paenibacillus sp. S150]|uniref:head-tail connector protein n=1 Tax=Paenibacillus sp. S150 TaxID=2749826 RepID=UPI001C5672D0|nr:head-tail connector protein [Paenibacillus sp. S150]MBW4083526.1 phage head-tail connector protein [Paenibacillus sp. S150]